MGAALAELAERYAQLGMIAAARAAMSRALEESGGEDTEALRRLSELALAGGDARAGRRLAERLVKAEGGAGARLLLGRAQLAVGEFSAARFAFAGVIDTAKASPLDKIRALLGRAKVADAEGDRSGATASILAAVADLVRLACTDDGAAVLESELALAEEVFQWACARDRAAEAGEHLDEAEASSSPQPLLRALWLAARLVHGDSELSDADVEACLRDELRKRPQSIPTQVRLCQSLLRRRYRDSKARQEASDLLDTLIRELEHEPGQNAGELASCCFLLAAAHEDDPGSHSQAERYYQKGLRYRPGNVLAMSRLSALRLEHGDLSGSAEAMVRALRVDSSHALAWRNVVRLLASPSADPTAVEQVLDAAAPGAGRLSSSFARNMLFAATEMSRSNVLAGLHARGHRLKNLLSIVGARVRSVRKLAAPGELSDKLGDIERALTALFEEWGEYLRSLHTSPLIEVFAALPLLRDVVAASRVDESVQVMLNVSGALPDLRGDRVLVREALLNVTINAVEAMDAEGRVDVDVRTEVRAGTRFLVVEVRDNGPGIPVAMQSQVFSPGFTTKSTGSGVGLAVAERVVSAHYGQISLESKPGRGTTVCLRFPADLAGFSTLGALQWGS